ncbi:NRDE family protein [Ferrimonas lipolytica]|uniref:NRDE family protein n=1 Tax=Ferrimonas lipolytica TaxID=2724191 RepID=A0A6H1UA46_9GAMM|nr:NRDE family protein [Ferrimonas lipolytica]QIZ75460.1 NRDE family protein [Ferrimonas lipolytica]
MCICAWNWQPDSQEPLLLIANRDEFYQRPATAAHFWPESPSLFAGQDLQAGGSWMGASLNGKIALVTNYRSMPMAAARRSRGDLIRDYLGTDSSAHQFVHQLRPQDYQGYNLLLLDDNGLHYHSNRGQTTVTTLEPGLYGLSNHLLDTPWPKVERLKRGLSENLAVGSDKALLALLRDPTQATAAALPSTGVPASMEQLLSSIFIHSDQYGTRNSSVLRLNQSGELRWLEQSYNQHGAGLLQQHQLQLPQRR